ncbi:helix-turn-helix domain-containing protein [Campylobacter sp. RM6883]|uniref:helix-turn-helix domain-containing protein n=1 Tax=Campylobacter californiensis TaxID=1032243 RepID=UPI001451D31C|nr:helix-turn-helix domain-containing protein [Campylobacter sp. RM6914]MBE2985341.1 helix-turn-helix domain-containing protein [Campylobacter sp. RM6883]MBE2995874.1 helix-turn-helix domain-containing protein [Campylobacter sp. RM6913]QCD51236.1 helix-turn-helix domain protein [Campylobacter sp. RM6914]
MSDDLQNGYAICFNSWLFDDKIQNELRLLLLISSLSAKNGYCHASNEYLGEKLGKSADTISAGITKLKKYGYIETEVEKFGAVITNRKIRILALEKANQSPTENLPFANGIDEKSDINSADLPFANGKNTVANGKNRDSERKICRPPYNVCARMNNTSSENYKPLKIQALNSTPLPPTQVLPDFLDPALWEQYLAYKKERKEKLSKQGIEMKFSEWSRWHSEGIDVNACIREAMANEWQGVFKPKTQGGSGRNVPNNATTNPHGLNQGTLNTMRAFDELAKDMIANGQGHLVGDFK